MYIKKNIFILVIILLIIIFIGAIFFTFRFLKKEANVASNPTTEVINSNILNFDQKTLDTVLKKLQ